VLIALRIYNLAFVSYTFVLVGSLLTRNQKLTRRVFRLRKREIKMIEDQIYVERGPSGVRFNMKVYCSPAYYAENGQLPLLAFPEGSLPPVLRLFPLSPVRLKSGIDAYLFVRHEDFFKVVRSTKYRRADSSLLSSILNLRKLMVINIDTDRHNRARCLVFPFMTDQSFWEAFGLDSVPPIGQVFVYVSHYPREKQLNFVAATLLNHFALLYYLLKRDGREWFVEEIANTKNLIEFAPFVVESKISQNHIFVPEPMYALASVAEFPDSIREVAAKYLASTKGFGPSAWFAYSGVAYRRLVKSAFDITDQQVFDRFKELVAQRFAGVEYEVDLSKTNYGGVSAAPKSLPSKP
jgi:hypothetical protein